VSTNRIEDDLSGADTNQYDLIAIAYERNYSHVTYLHHGTHPGDRAYRPNTKFLIKLPPPVPKRSRLALPSPKPSHNPNPVIWLPPKMALFLQIRFTASPPRENSSTRDSDTSPLLPPDVIG
jgi:hypothetical protein